MSDPGEKNADSSANPGSQADPLSATGMFLSGFGKEADPAEDVLAAPTAASPREPLVSPSRQPGAPGEFTQIFQSLRPLPATPASSPTPVQPWSEQPFRDAAAQTPEKSPRIFVQQFPPAAGPLPTGKPGTPLAADNAPPSSPARRGFSSPGVSDSASSEGSGAQPFRDVSSRPVAGTAPAIAAGRADDLDADVTQPLPTMSSPTPFTPPSQAARVIPAAPVTPPVQQTPSASPAPFAPVAPAPPFGSQGPSSESSFTQIFRSPATPLAAPAPFAALQEQRRDVAAPANDASWARPFDPGTARPTPGTPVDKAASPSVTELFRTLSSPDPVAGRPGDPFDSYSAPVSPAAPVAPPTGPGLGGVTMLMQKLMEEGPAAPAPPSRFEPAPPPVDSGPGEYTRIISGEAYRAAVAPVPAAQPPAPAGSPAFQFQAPPLPAAPAMPALPLHAAPAPAAPPAVPQAAIPMPPVPAIATPKLAAPPVPAVAAPKSKLQEMLPLLLVLNAFLLVVLIVIAFFALRSH